MASTPYNALQALDDHDRLGFLYPTDEEGVVEPLQIFPETGEGNIFLAATFPPLPAESIMLSVDERPPVHRITAQGSVQALVVHNDIAIAGLQDGTLAGWSLQDYQRLFSIKAHEQSILTLFVCQERELLFSSGVDSVVQVWSLQNFAQTTCITSFFEVGDIFCLAYSVSRNTLFAGCQNGAIQYAMLEQGDVEEPPSPRPGFFESIRPGEVAAVGQDDNALGTRSRYFPTLTYRPYAHSSYIYCMILVKGLPNHDEDREILITGGGDGAIKQWSFSNTGQLMLIAEYETKGLNVLSMTFGGLFLYAGMSNGLVLVYNPSINQLVHKIQAGAADVTSIQVLAGMPLVGSSQGQITHVDTHFTEVESWSANKGKILATSLAKYGTKDVLLTAGNDYTIAVWDISDMVDATTPLAPHDNNDMIQSLREFVSYRSVAANPEYASDCHEAVKFLCRMFRLFAAKSIYLLPTDSNTNPIVVARFEASVVRPKSRRTVLFYGHYDVVDAEVGEENGGWASDPFKLHPSDGYLYGRGVTDNKGPILAAMFAVAELVSTRSLSCNVVFLLEGEEEAGSSWFHMTIERDSDKIGEVDYILLSNSYWLDDCIPCLTYGMRGVIHATVTVDSGKVGQHSGMDGIASQNEPLKDLIWLMAELSGRSTRTIQIPRFYRDIRGGKTQWEEQQYDFIANTLMQGHPEIRDKKRFLRSLEERWQSPNLTIHALSVPESKNTMTISPSAKATLSIRIVPDQVASTIGEDLEKYLMAIFKTSGSTNELDVEVTSQADPWLADPMSLLFNTLSQAVTDVWHSEEESGLRSFPPLSTSPPRPTGQPALKRPTHRRASSLAPHGSFKPENLPKVPLFLREGASIHGIDFLENWFGAKAAMFPMGQASDNAHLANERIRVENLYKGKAILKKVFSEL